MKKYAIYLILLIISAVYYSTTARTLLPNGDSGELVTTAYFGGIAHPPGYPLYNLIGHIFLELPILGEPAFRLNLMSVFLHILCLYFFYKSCLLLSNNKTLLSILMVTALASSYSFWLYSTVAEVFALHDLLFSILFYLFLKVYFSKKQQKIIRLSLFWAFVFGLAMSNNHLIVLILPAYIVILYRKNKKYVFFDLFLNKLTIIIKLLVCFLIGLLPYAYFLWARNNTNPMTWIYPDSLWDVFRIFFRLNYGNFLNYHDYGFIGLQNKDFITNMLTETISFKDDFWLFSYLVPIALLGVFFLINRMKRLRIYLFLLIFPHVLLMMILKIGLYNYSFAVFERLFLTFHIILIIITVIFLSHFFDKLKNKAYINLSYLILIFLIFFMTLINYKKTNQINNNICKNYYEDVIHAVPEDSITLIEGDIQTFCFVYHHYVLGNFRRDTRIFVFSNYFLKKNNGRFLKQYYNFKSDTIEKIFDLAGKGKKKIFYTGGNIPQGLFVEPHGVLNLLLNDKSKTDYEKIFHSNLIWFSNSQLLTKYDKSFLNLSNRALKELYCGQYLGQIIFFLNARKNEYAESMYAGFDRFCQVGDFSTRQDMNYDLNRVRAKFPSVTH